MSKSNLLLNYLYSHHMIDGEMYDVLAQQVNEDNLRDQLVASGLLHGDELNKLESFLSSMPLYRGNIQAVPAEVLALVPYELAMQYRLLCVEHRDSGLVLLTDQLVVQEEMFSWLPDKVAAIYRIDSARFDTLLDRYNREVEEVVRYRIQRAAKRVRTIEAYGSRSMAMFFPADYKREIAEDLASHKLLQHLVALGDIKCASRITLRVEGNRLRVFGTIAEAEHSLIELNKSIAYAVYLKLRYLADASLDEIEDMQESIISNLDADNRARRFRVGFVPHSQGITCVLEDTTANRATLALARAGLGDDDVRESHRALHTSQGMLLISGGTKSGKSFIVYCVAQALGAIKRTTLLEEQIEHQLSGLDQQTYSQRADKDLQAADSWYDAIVLAPLFERLVVPAYNIACRKWVVGEVRSSASAVVRVLLAGGVRVESIARTLKLQLVTRRFTALDTTKSNTTPTRMCTQDEIETINRYVSLPHFQDVIAKAGEEQVPESWQTIRWNTTTQSHKKTWFNWRSVYHTFDLQKDSYQYARALLPLGEVIADSHRRGESFLQFEHTLRYAEKEYLAPRALLLAYQGVIAIDEVIEMLRN